jgi:hypothetical protein
MSECPWGKEIQEYQNNIIRIPHNVPFHIDNKSPESFIGKLKYRVSEYSAKKGSKRNPYDRSINFGIKAFEEAKKIITEKGIKNVIVSGGPYDFLFDIAQLKKEFDSEVNLIYDQRDPWTEKYGKDLKNDLFKIQERKKNEFVLANADKIFGPSVGIYRGMTSFWGDYVEKMKLIPHGFDNDLFDNYKFKKGFFDQWFYAGTVYSKLYAEMNVLKGLLNITKAKLNIYTFNNRNDYDLYSNESIIYNNVVSQESLLNKTKNSGVAIVFLPHFRKDDKTSKFFELIKSGKFLLYIGVKGAVSDFIVEHNIGYVYDIKQPISEMKIVAEEIMKAFRDFSLNESNIVDDYSMLSIAKSIKKELI